MTGSDLSGGPSIGIWVEGSGHRIVDSDLGAAFGPGIWLADTTDVVARDNRVVGGFDTPAILVEASAGTTLNANRVTGASADGISVDAASTGTLLRFNHVSQMRDGGIDVESASTSLNSNTANENGAWGSRRWRK